MIVVVAYDISREEVRRQLRRLLGKMGLSIINRSVYAGVGGFQLAKRIADEAKKIIEGDDNVFIIVVREEEYLRAYSVTSVGVRKIGEDKYELA